MLTVAVLEILIMAPLGSIAIAASGPYLLQQDTDHLDDSNSVAGGNQLDLTWDDHLDFDTELTKMKVTINRENGPREVTAERETVA